MKIQSTRRRSYRNVTLLAGLCLLCSEVSSLAKVSDHKQPNFVIIFADDQGYQDLGCFGSPDIATPNIDGMAKNGMRFTDFYVASPVCTPSRAGLLTGRYPKRFGMDKGVLFPTSETGLPPSEVTIAEMLKPKGYATACIGKWHLGHLKQFLPTSQGFDSYYGVPYSNDMYLGIGLDYAKDIKLRENMTLEGMKDILAQKRGGKSGRQKVPLMRDEQVIEFPADQTTLTRRYAEEAVRFIEANKDQPFFIYMTPAMPHVPLFASEAFKGKSKGGLYGDTVEEIDWAVGEVLKCLEANRLSENTLVIFTSDNGPWLSKGEDGGHALPLRNGKGSTFEGGLRVPCVMSMPGTIPTGVDCSEISSTIDLLPTFAKFAGVVPEQTLDGVDLSPLLKAESFESAPRTSMLYQHYGGYLSAIRVGDWKLVLANPVTGYAQKFETKVYPKGKGQLKEFELYNLREDIGEQNNMVSKYPERVARMLERAMAEDARLSRANKTK